MGECELCKEERDVLGGEDERNRPTVAWGRFSTLGNSPRTIVILGDKKWPAKGEIGSG